MAGKKYIYLFSEGRADMKQLLGGKGANLAEMTNIGLPVPPGITITCEACNEYIRLGRQFPEGLEEELKARLKDLEALNAKKLGDPKDPLLVSVRSGAPVSMPGMMDTILNLGLNDESVKGLAANTNDERFALDCYRRFIQMFGDVVLGIDHDKFEAILEKHKERLGVKFDNELTPAALQEVIAEYKDLVRKEVGRDFPQDPQEQLRMAVRAVFDSWDNPRAIVYRKINKIPDDLGTAVNIQTMVFGNMGPTSGTGVAFTRNPATGEKGIYGEYLINAQGEDVVAGIRTPKPIAELKKEMPDTYRQFEEICALLEKHYRDMQDIEFTIERGKLYILQTRVGKRTAAAAVKIAVDMVEEGLISQEEAILRVDPDQVVQLLHRRVDPEAKVQVIAKGLPASPGAASGKVVFDADEAERKGLDGEKVILVRNETTPDDIHGIVQAQGVLTARGGMTSHAAVVARGMGKPAVVGCGDLKIDVGGKRFFVGSLEVKEGDVISIDGATGNVMLGEVPLVEPQLSGEFQTLLQWADGVRRLKVRANADTPEDARRAREFGAEGIGLARTEHMFMGADRLPVVQQMILAKNKEEREAALAKLLPMQQGDFYEILKVMEGLPVTIRLLDPPLHEFLPSAEELLVEITRLEATGQNPEELEAKRDLLREVRAREEFNPMLGHRGCRLGVTYPEVYAMQARAIFRAVAQLKKEGINVLPEVEIPLVIHVNELRRLRQLVNEVADEVKKETGVDFDYKVGTMIELPRACATADEIAEEAEFFSFGTNDLTQTTFGFSRDDAEAKFLPQYLEEKILKENPFMVLDRQGVGKFMRMAVELGRKTRPELEVGICGEHGGEASSVEFCHLIGLNYVSCSPFRVPVARLAAAQAVIKEKKDKEASYSTE
ncbi:pyruvate, phosphate dikinase [Thermanaeromonas sp. C210]|uniref:pyruvate, phosphate dikinase n=1 Tax=Thermanaeromonas sp. C210 TaxID=2731925 RepID=UPI00155C7C33|nr:pyruvate, phosphate dikinase [Thermanaeromonas sp. C210]GFN22499.1 pyruvate, phosphate dikinase [Thermanaeromonas sp. C210]